MSSGIFNIHKPKNESVPGYLPGSLEKEQLKAALSQLQQTQIDIPLIIGGQEVRTGHTGTCIVPHNKAHALATYHMAGENEVNMAIEAAREAKSAWERLPWDHRLAVFLKAAELVVGPWRHTLNAATMLGQGKSVFEADADAACELADFFRFNSYFAGQILAEQPVTVPGAFNRLDYRPLEGFVLAVTPFNFTAIGGNLPSSPAMLGNTVVWKPASTAVYSNYQVIKLLQAAGLPDGVINFVPGPGGVVGPIAMAHPMLAGVHFTGSTAVFNQMWQTIGQKIDRYHSYPRIVGETGGKDFVFAHPSADVDALAPAIIAGGFSYQGQKCSATSRVYIPRSLWPTLKTRLVDEVAAIAMGDVADFTHYMGAVIDQAAFDNIRTYIRYAETAENAEIIAGGQCDDQIGYFIQPTLIETSDPLFKTMQEEIFGPVVTIFVYPDEACEKALALCRSTSRYALTGAIFAQDRHAIAAMETQLRHSAGNFYINDKTTGAFVGQQPFGGGRASGTNEKVGSKQNMTRWLSPRTIKEHFNPALDYRLALMHEA